MPHRNVFKKILFCADFSDNSEIAFKYALNIAEGNPECEIIIFHIVPEPDAQFWKSYIYELDEVDAKAKADIDAKIGKAYTSKIPSGIKYSVKMAVGRVNQSILDAAGETDADLIILGRQGSSKFKTLFYGNTAGYVARKALCPVLIIPGKKSIQLRKLIFPDKSGKK
ncbi:MAG: universal stress protein [Spirochaetia bacterium]|jgi:nucleotide-binding universal stress UspA family protein|nr:universal stress protein [Spirochaetia bacterium]